MKKPALSEKLISLWKKIHIWDSNHHSSRDDENRKEITIEEIYDILGSPHDSSLENVDKKMHPQINMSHAIDPSAKEEIYKYLVLIKTEIKEGREHRTVAINQDSYIKRVKEKSREYGLEIGKHIFIETNPGKIHISETNSTYHTKHKITVKKLNIKVGMSSFQMFFDQMRGEMSLKAYPPESNLVKDLYNGGTYLIFEDNLFVSTAPNRINTCFDFSLGNNMYLIFRKNIFKSVDIYLLAKGNSITELADNRFENRHVTIRASSHSHGQGYNSGSPGAYYDSGKGTGILRMEELVNESRKTGSIDFSEFIGNIENKIKQGDSEVNNKDILSMLLYMDKKIAVNPDDMKSTRIESLVRLTSNVIFKLNISNAIYYFKGRNIINNLEMSKNITHLYWGAYQDIDPNKDYPYAHRQVFIDFIERAVENNDKIQEAILRKELLKCERAITLQESRKNSWQDRVILFWSSSVSDYGTSWLRPLLGLFIINILFATIVVVFLFEPKYSWWFFLTEFKPEVSWRILLADWSVLFFQFFNPLSNLADVTGIKNNGWISFIHILQKAFLAALLYEMIKIFRRFSK